jgi:low temperature requirement protein LtrA
MSIADTAALEAELRAEPEKRVAPLELFFDLVFVFALTQVPALMSENPTWEGTRSGDARSRGAVA